MIKMMTVWPASPSGAGAGTLPVLPATAPRHGSGLAFSAPTAPRHGSGLPVFGLGDDATGLPPRGAPV